VRNKEKASPSTPKSAERSRSHWHWRFAWAMGLLLSALPLVAAAPATAPASRPALYSAPAEADVARYRQIIGTLASEEMEGRGVGTKGLELARDYIVERFEKAGLRVPAPHAPTTAPVALAGFLQPLEIRAGLSVKQSKLSIAGRDGAAHEFRRGTDYAVMGLSQTKTVEGELVFVGYGVKNNQQKYDSYATDGKPTTKNALKGKIAVCWRYEPMSQEHKSKWGSNGSWVSAQLNAKAALAAAHGAAALLYVNPPSHAKEPLSPPPDGAMLTLPIPVIHLTPAALKSILAQAGRPADDEALVALQRDADAGKTGPMNLEGVTLSLSLDFQLTQAQVHNVIGVLPGAGKLADQFIFVGGHYDHLGQSGSGSAKRIFTGADDNASGTAGMVLLAERFARRAAEGQLPANRRSMVFVAFAAEERGLLGSRHLVKRFDDLGIKQTQIVAMVNLDMIGRMRDDAIMIGGVGSGDRWDAMLDAAIEGSDVKVRRGSSGYGASDHSSFYGAKIPVLFFNTGLHPELHTPRDTLALINFEGAVKSINLADGILRQLLGEEQRMAYVAPKPGQNPIADMMRRGAYLGFSPGEAPGELKGVAIDTLTDDGPAAKAGLKVGDVIEKIGDTPITSPADLRTLLMKYQGGEKVKIAARRGEESVEVEATLGKR